MIDVRQTVLPAEMTISNATKNFTFIGTGAIGGFGGLRKDARRHGDLPEHGR